MISKVKCSTIYVIEGFFFSKTFDPEGKNCDQWKKRSLNTSPGEKMLGSTAERHVLGQNIPLCYWLIGLGVSKAGAEL